MLPDEVPDAVPHESPHAPSAPVGASPRALFEGPGEMRARCRAFDWGATALGAVDTWPASLRATAETVLASAFSAIVLWSPELVQLYNDAYIPFLGVKHPAGLGQPTRACWPEVWHLTAPIYARVLGGETVFQEDARFPLQRRGPDAPADDVYITLSFSPVRDETGGVGGILATLVDTTAQVLGRAAQAEREQLEARLSGALLNAALLLDQMSDGHIVLDPAFRIVTLNPSAERALGRSRATLLGQTHWEAFPASVGTEMERQYRRVAAEGVEAHFIHHYVGEGYDFHLEIDAYPARDGGVAVFWREISARVRLLAENEAARLEAEERVATLAAVLDNIPDALLVMRPGEITSANRVALDQLGVTSVESLQAAPGQASPLEKVFIHPSSGVVLPLAATPIGRAFAGERSHAQVLLRALGRDATRPVRAAAAPILTEGGEVLGVVAVLTDMTRQQQANAERDRLLAESEAARSGAEASFAQAQAAYAEARAASAELQVANRAKTEFLAVMSHELRTPLNAIGGYAELLDMGLHGPITPEQRTALDRIQRSQRHLLGLINGVLNYTKSEAGAVHYEVADVSLPEVLAECGTLVGPQARAKGLTLQPDSCAEPLSARADGEKLRQIVLNLLSNAVKFTRSGGRVSLECVAHGGGTVAVRVADTGRGIASDQLERVFQPFVQLDASLTRTHEGTGLGLAISRDLARGMGGDLTVASEVGVGSTFTLTLPLA